MRKKLKRNSTKLARKDKEVNSLDKVSQLIQEWDSLKEHEKQIKKRIEELKPRVFSIAEEMGAKDDKGSFNFIFNNERVLSKQARFRVTINNNTAEDLLKSRKLWDRAVKVVEQIDEDAIEQLYTEGLLSDEDLESIVDKKLTYACVISKYEPPKEDEDMPTISVSNRSK